jgi:hypothetical protein
VGCYPQLTRLVAEKILSSSVAVKASSRILYQTTQRYNPEDSHLQRRSLLMSFRIHSGYVALDSLSALLGTFTAKTNSFAPFTVPPKVSRRNRSYGNVSRKLIINQALSKSSVFGSNYHCEQPFNLRTWYQELGHVLLMATWRDACESQQQKLKPATDGTLFSPWDFVP